MGVDILLQLRQAAVSLAAGAAAGLVYDFFAVLRRDTGLAGALLLDSLFCLLMAAGLFLIGYGRGGAAAVYAGLSAWRHGRLFYCFGRTSPADNGQSVRLAGPGGGICGPAAEKTVYFSEKIQKFCKKTLSKTEKMVYTVS